MRKRQQILLILCFIVIYYLTAGILLLEEYAYGVGLSVSPGTILIQDFPVGEFYDFAEQKHYTLRIQNEDEVNHTYVMKAERPSESESFATGFYDFPHPEWFYFEVETILVEALSEEKIGIFMEIPEKEGWFNHNWLLGISVMPLPGKVTGGTISLGAYLLFRFETETDESAVPILGEDEMVLTPSKLTFNDVVPGELYQKKVKLYHPFESSRQCVIYPLDPTTGVAKLTILLSKGYSRVPTHDWVVCDSMITLEPQEPYELDIFLQIPPVERQKMEEILILEVPGIDRKAFLRVQMNLKK